MHSNIYFITSIHTCKQFEIHSTYKFIVKFHFWKTLQSNTIESFPTGHLYNNYRSVLLLHILKCDCLITVTEYQQRHCECYSVSKISYWLHGTNINMPLFSHTEESNTTLLQHFSYCTFHSTCFCDNLHIKHLICYTLCYGTFIPVHFLRGFIE
jgi:hypothetical protein